MAKAEPRIIKGAATIFENQLAKVQTVKRRPRHKTGAGLSKSGAQSEIPVNSSSSILSFVSDFLISFSSLTFNIKVDSRFLFERRRRTEWAGRFGSRLLRNANAKMSDSANRSVRKRKCKI
jgi:hypothetical protein